ncbi:MAG: hypothetical protein ACKO40_14305 [Planctomycetaceae bacterium]
MSFKERQDGPRPDEGGRLGRRRTKHTRPRTVSEHDLAQHLFTCRRLHDLADELEPHHRVGRPLQITPVVALVLEALAGRFGTSQRETVLKHTVGWVWEHYCHTVRTAFPDEPHMWLPEKPPTRSQLRYWLDTRLGDDPSLETFGNALEDIAVEISALLGIGTPHRDSISHPTLDVGFTGDATYLRGMYNTSTEEAINTETGEIRTRRVDPDAKKIQQDKGYPGYRMTHVSAHNGHDREELVYAIDITPGQQGSDATTFLDMALSLYPRLPGMRTVTYDGAMHPVHIDRALSAGLIAINHVQLTAKGEVARFNIGEHTFTTRTGHQHTAVITFVDGPPCVTIATAEGRHETPLTRGQNKRRPNANGTYTFCGEWSYPDEPIVPAHLRGATTLIRFNSTDNEIATNRRRTRAGRIIPAGDPDFPVTYGGRNNTENRHHQLKIGLPNKRLNVSGINRVRRRLTAHFLARNIEAALAWHERTRGDITPLLAPPPTLADTA